MDLSLRFEISEKSNYSINQFTHLPNSPTLFPPFLCVEVFPSFSHIRNTTHDFPAASDTAGVESAKE